MAGIVMVVRDFPKATETFIVSKFFGLLDRGWDVHVACMPHTPATWSFYPQHQLTPEIAARLHGYGKGRDPFSVLQPTIIHVEFGNIVPRVMQRIAPLESSLVVSFRGRDIESFQRDQTDAYQPVWDRANMIHFVGESLVDTARQRGCPPEMPYHVIPSSIDTTVFHDPQRTHDAVLGTAARPVRVATIARMNWKKGLIYSLEAIRLLAERGVRCHYTVVGGGSDLEHIQFTVEDLGISHLVTLAGTVPRDGVIEVLKQTDVYVQPSVSEGFCNAALEAAAMLLPVIATDAGSLPENVAHGETGLVLPRRNAAAIADSIELLAKDPATRMRMGQAGRARVVGHFGLTYQLDRIEAMYLDVLKRKADQIRSG